ncbi:MAG: aspartate aminotransferase [Candidatus Sungbacteria bacterium RIFCSPLOWO2_01_FULL_60_25]|uniref:Aminotransferase n=1 Tax=Candidatus Sungbacteria bacterium RIFCSPLOWO2_01_FULL_60_25 TaxID=1802281 RepID=A0A1G2LE25_9BACT|nr:MAG: aspartate aminotransferase [Candidatus Sungbacteria bacterium RIFCSPLOWO2_01_FULL_60_25]
MDSPRRFHLAKNAERMKGEAAYAMLAQAQELERMGKNIVHLEIGEPDFSTPEHISASGANAIRDGKTKYTATLGIPELRSAIASYVNQTRGVRVSPEMVAVTPSAKTAIYLAMTAILEPGDEVIYPNPGFPVYENVIEFLGCVAKPVPLLEKNDFSFDLDAFKNLLTKKTKLVILNSPSNPTGGVIPLEDLKTIARLVKKTNAWIMSDEIYSRISYGHPRPASLYRLPGMQERTIFVDGFSKTYAMTGWRLGYFVMPERSMGAIENLLVNSIACTATFVQIAGVKALNGPQNTVRTMVKEFEKRRDFVIRELNTIPGFSCQIPRGAFYAFPNIKKTGMSSEKLARHILYKAGVALLPGTAFGKYGEGYLRISYANSMENLKEALTRIKKSLE